MKIKQLLFLFIGFWVLPFAHSQTTAASDTLSKPKGWELGVDLLGIFGKNHVPTTSLFARYNFATKTNQYWGGRLRVGMSRDEQYFVSNFSIIDSNYQYNYYGSLGLERQFIVNEKIRCFIFLDGFYEKQFDYRYYGNVIVEPIVDTLLVNSRHNNTTTYGLNLGGGLQYQINKHFAFSIETVLTGFKSFVHSYGERLPFFKPGIELRDSRDFTDEFSTLFFKPLYTFQIIYKFK